MKKVLYITDRGCNIPYLDKVLTLLHSDKKISVQHANLYDYIQSGDSQNQFDILIYQTFPHENHPNKWNHSLIKNSDKKFLEFKGHSILFDAHDSSSVDAFSRFKNVYPRIKNSPSKQYFKNFDVILETAFCFREDNFWSPHILQTNENRNYDVSYCVSYGYDPKYAQGIVKKFTTEKIRENVRDILKSSKHDVDMEWHDNYSEYMKQVLISVCVPGWCEGSLRHLESLNYGALMFSHESINDCKIVPNVDLIDGEDYVSFNLGNLEERLNYLLSNKDEIDRIRFNGHRKFKNGYDFNKSADKLFKYIEGING